MKDELKKMQEENKAKLMEILPDYFYMKLIMSKAKKQFGIEDEKGNL